ncbi:hypothetical protein GCM10028785_33290 [Hydrogenophaga soli]
MGAVALLSACGTSNPQPSGLVFPAAATQGGGSAFGRGLDAVDATAINPFDPIALNNQAVAEAARGRYQQAASLLQRAVKLAPARADIAANLLSLQRWMAQVEGQAALGMAPQPLQVPFPEAGVPEVPPLWAVPSSSALPTRPTPGPTVGGAPGTRVSPAR